MHVGEGRTYTTLPDQVEKHDPRSPIVSDSVAFFIANKGSRGKSHDWSLQERCCSTRVAVLIEGIPQQRTYRLVSLPWLSKRLS